MDTVLVDHNLAVGETTPRHNYTGEYGFITMDLSITVHCAQNFEGSDCAQCVPGFTGTNCDVDIDDCVGVMQCNGNGVCVDGINSFSCDCEPGFVGEYCGKCNSYCMYVILMVTA